MLTKRRCVTADDRARPASINRLRRVRTPRWRPSSSSWSSTLGAVVAEPRLPLRRETAGATSSARSPGSRSRPGRPPTSVTSRLYTPAMYVPGYGCRRRLTPGRRPCREVAVADRAQRFAESFLVRIESGVRQDPFAHEVDSRSKSAETVECAVRGARPAHAPQRDESPDRRGNPALGQLIARLDDDVESREQQANDRGKS